MYIGEAMGWIFGGALILFAMWAASLTGTFMMALYGDQSPMECADPFLKTGTRWALYYLPIPLATWIALLIIPRGEALYIVGPCILLSFARGLHSQVRRSAPVYAEGMREHDPSISVSFSESYWTKRLYVKMIRNALGISPY